MNKLEIAKKTVSFIVGSGTGTITGAIIHNNVNTTDASSFKKVTVGCATFVIGAMAANTTRAHTEAQIDEAVSAIRQLKKN